MTWEPLLGGAVLALGASVWAMTERLLRSKAERVADRMQNERDLLQGRFDDAKTELTQQRLLLVDERERLEAVVASQGATIADLRRKLDEVAVRDPVLAAERLDSVLKTGGGLTAANAAQAVGGDEAGVSAAPAADLGAGGRGARGKR